MPSTPRHPDRRTFRALAVILAIEIVATAAVPVAAAAISVGRSAPVAVHVAGPTTPAVTSTATPLAADPTLPAPRPTRPASPATTAERAADPGARPTKTAPVLTTRPATKPKPATRARRPVTVVRRPTYHGTNRVWSTALGLDRAVAGYPCSRKRAPDMAVYRWGCAGANNVYLLAHAGGAFRRLHDLYVRGGLRRGMTVTYADARGRIHHYAVAWWRVVLPTQGEFAYAAQSRSAMTLQTCVGAGDRYRLVVRLYETR